MLNNLVNLKKNEAKKVVSSSSCPRPGRKGVDTLGGLRPTKPPRKKSCQLDVWLSDFLWFARAILWPMISFKQFPMSHLSARSNLVNCCLIKNWTSYGYKPIRVLTRWTISCSDDRLLLGYSLPQYKPHRSTFLVFRQQIRLFVIILNFGWIVNPQEFWSGSKKIRLRST